MQMKGIKHMRSQLLEFEFISQTNKQTKAGLPLFLDTWGWLSGSEHLGCAPMCGAWLL